MADFAEATSESHERGVWFALGGTPPVADRVSKPGFFEKVFDGSESSEQVLAYITGQPAQGLTASDFPQRVTDRIAWRAPYAILCHLFGLPSMKAIIREIQQMAEAQALDLI